MSVLVEPRVTTHTCCDEPGHLKEVPANCSCEGPIRCGVPCLERPAFHPGQLLTADILRMGQRYVEDRLALTRYVHGVGVACGLYVRCDPEDPRYAIVDPGYAITCCGQDLVLCEPVRFDLCGAIASCPSPEPPCPEPVHEEASVARDDWARAERIREERIREERIHEERMREERGYEANRGWLNPNPSHAFPDEGAKQPSPTRVLERYTLRIEPVWEGADPVPVVVSRASCDPRGECRPSKEVMGVRLCVSPAKEAGADALARRRRDEFRAVARALFERVVYALQTAEQEDWGRAVTDAVLLHLRSHPAHSYCSVYDALCEVRRFFTGKPAACSELAPATAFDAWVRLLRIGMAIVDDLRSSYLTQECEDCCTHAGVGLAEIVVDQRLASCNDGCSVLGIDTHPPGREVLHPRNGWWRSDAVPLYDAYYRSSSEAGVMLAARGVQVVAQDVSLCHHSPTIGREFLYLLASYGGRTELPRLGAYQNSDLYAPWGSEVIAWTVQDRVVAMEVARLDEGGGKLDKPGWARYLAYTFRNRPDFARPAPTPESEEGKKVEIYAAEIAERARSSAAWAIRGVPEGRLAEEVEIMDLRDMTREEAVEKAMVLLKERERILVEIEPEEGVKYLETRSGDVVVPELEDEMREAAFARAAEALVDRGVLRIPMSPLKIRLGNIEVRPTPDQPGPTPERPQPPREEVEVAPLKEMISGIGDAFEKKLFRGGIVSLESVKTSSFDELREVMGRPASFTPELHVEWRKQADMILKGEKVFDADVVSRWTESATRRFAKIREEDQ